MPWWKSNKLDSADWQHRDRAVREVESNRDVDGLVSALSNRYDDVRRKAAFALAEIRDQRATSTLLQMLSGQEGGQWRTAAIQALGALRSESSNGRGSKCGDRGT